jgi:hypothetical protein
MSESKEGAAHDLTSPQQPQPPHWKGQQSLDLVYQLNERCIELLSEAAASAALTGPPILADNRELWMGLTSDERQRAARMPFVMLDVRFKNTAWWMQIAQGRTHEPAAESCTGGLSPEASEPLTQEIVMFAWQTARWDETVAELSFGMSSAVARVIATLTPQKIRAIALREHAATRVRWDDDSQLWRELLSAAKANHEEKLASLHLQAKLLLCSELTRLPE